MFTIEHLKNSGFRVILPDGTVTRITNYDLALFFTWRGDNYVAHTDFYTGPDSANVYKIIEQPSTQVDHTL